MPAKVHPNAAIMKEKTTAGPAFIVGGLGSERKKPAPMIAPMPRAMRFTGRACVLTDAHRPRFRA